MIFFALSLRLKPQTASRLTSAKTPQLCLRFYNIAYPSLLKTLGFNSLYRESHKFSPSLLPFSLLSLSLPPFFTCDSRGRALYFLAYDLSFFVLQIMWYFMSSSNEYT